MIFSVSTKSISLHATGARSTRYESKRPIRLSELDNVYVLQFGSLPGSPISQYGVGPGSTIFLLPFIGTIVTAYEDVARKQRRSVTTSTAMATFRMFMNRYMTSEPPNIIQDFLPLLLAYYRKVEICQSKNMPIKHPLSAPAGVTLQQVYYRIAVACHCNY